MKPQINLKTQLHIKAVWEAVTRRWKAQLTLMYLGSELQRGGGSSGQGYKYATFLSA